MQSNSTDRQEQLNIETTVMAIREEVMRYFKGGCVQRLIVNTNVKLKSHHSHNTTYQYQRQSIEDKRPMLLLIGNTPILSLEQAPDKIIFHKGVMSRSKQLQEVMKQLEKFTKDFLSGVERDYSDASILTD